MSYDLTPLLTTIAASSASFVAILGGFIASKMISISDERDAVLTRIHEVEQQQSYKQAEFLQLQTALFEGHSLDFISNNINALAHREKLENVYREDIQQSITKKDLEPYWNRANNLAGELFNSFEGEEKLNEDKIPVSLAKKYSQDHFAYSVFQELMSWIAKQQKKPKTNPLFPQYDFDNIVTKISYVPLNTKRIEDLESELKWLNFQHLQLAEEKKRLSKPRGMKAGLIIFGLFSLGCIILPLILSPLSIETVQAYRMIKVTVLFLFCAGLGSIFLYLAYLLQWEDGDEKRL